MQLGWIDFSEKDRKKALDVIHLLDEKGAMDELGIGVVRDAFSNRFFPGTSTVQTRAKYFFMIPYIIKECCEDRRNKTVEAVKRMIDEREKACAVSMKNAGETDGVIGADVIPDKWVVRKPYSIYWNGIRRFGIFKRPYMMLNDYIQYVLKHRDEKPVSNWSAEGEENEQDDKGAGSEGQDPFWNLPEEYHPGWEKNLHIELTKGEAQHLRDCILSLEDGCLLKTVVEHNIPLIDYTRNEEEPFRMLYNHLKNDGHFAESMKQTMLMALRFDSLVYLSIVLYNRILSEDQNDNATKAWDENFEQRLSELAALDLDDLFVLTKVEDRKAKCFLEDMLRYFLSGDICSAKERIIAREVELKGSSRSKLLNRSALPPKKWVGGTHLDYRMRVTARLINDLYTTEGLNHA